MSKYTTVYGWLIERPDTGPDHMPQYWGPTFKGGMDWIGDHERATRFARREDAQGMIDYFNWDVTDETVRPVEHGWDAAQEDE